MKRKNETREAYLARKREQERLRLQEFAYWATPEEMEDWKERKREADRRYRRSHPKPTLSPEERARRAKEVGARNKEKYWATHPAKPTPTPEDIEAQRAAKRAYNRAWYAAHPEFRERMRLAYWVGYNAPSELMDAARALTAVRDELARLGKAKGRKALR